MAHKRHRAITHIKKRGLSLRVTPDSEGKVVTTSVCVAINSFRTSCILTGNKNSWDEELISRLVCGMTEPRSHFCRMPLVL